MIEQLVNIDRMEHALALFGSFDENVRLIEQEYGVTVTCRGTEIKVFGDEQGVSFAVRTITGLLSLINKGETLSDQNVRYVMAMVSEGREDKVASLADDVVCITTTGKPVKAKTLGQKKYIEMIRSNTITIGVGPAGTGKTYLAVAMAVRAFRAHEINRIILTRPAVEAGEKYVERQNIEVAPLAYMRGRTLDDSFIILDEAQNTTPEQMKMFLTRLGFNSKAIITGDVTQIDLPDTKRSGLLEAIKVLKNVGDIGILHFTEKDVVRHRLVQAIIKAYERYYEEGKRNR